MTSWNETSQEVERRALSRCEYCRMHQSLQGATFHIEHIYPICLGGTSELNNLTLACPSCNLHKSNRVFVKSPEGQEIPLFHPRHDLWEQHFSWDGFYVVALTPIGQATISLLDLNHERKIRIRHAESLFDLFPP
jgi:hypothetical protein